MKRYVLIAGVNGAGKSTLYYLLQNLNDMPRVNTDEIVKEFGKWDDPNCVLKAGKVAVNKIKQYMHEEVSFNQETTLCGKSILKNIKDAKSKGYFIEVHYVGVDSVDIAKDRVRHRVKNGGHGIPEHDIERRYVETFRNLRTILTECDLIVFYDNTTEFKMFAVYGDGEQLMLSQDVPKWFHNIVD